MTINLFNKLLKDLYLHKHAGILYKGKLESKDFSSVFADSFNI